MIFNIQRRYKVLLVILLWMALFAIGVYSANYQVVGPVRTTVLVTDEMTIAVDDATPDVSTGVRFTTSANSGPIAITDLDNPTVDQVIQIVGGSNTNSSTITDGGNFSLEGNWTASLDAVLILYVQADNDYIEVARSTPDVLLTSGTDPGHAHTGGSLEIAGDLVAGGGTTGGADNVLPGPDADVTIAVGAGDGVIVNADEIEVFGLVASDGSPTTAVVTDADGDVSFGQAAASMETTSQIEVLMDADKNILIDGRTNNRNMTQGVMRFEHTPAIPDTRALHFDIEANGQGDTHGIFLAVHADDIVAGEDMMGLEVSLDKSNSTGGVIEGLRVSTGGSGSAESHALHVDAGVDPIHHESGPFVAIEQGWDENGGFTDTTVAFNTDGTDVTIFSANADMIYIGDDADFNAIQVNLVTPASNPGVIPTFEYSIAGPAWTVFTPSSDGTNGFRSSGTIAWDESTFTSWVATTINTVNKKYIRITRTQGGLGTEPVEKTIQVAATVEFGWDENADLSIGGLVSQNISDSTTAVQVLDADGGTPILNVDTTNERVGIGTVGPDRKLDVLDASNPQLRLTHTDGTVYTDLKTDVNGDLVITPTGANVFVPNTIIHTGDSSTYMGFISVATVRLQAGGTGMLEVENGAIGIKNDAPVGLMTIGDGTKHDGYVIRNTAEVQTTDATADVVLDNVTLLDENTYHVEAFVVGVESDGSNRASYHIAATVYRTGAGGATLQGTVTSMHTQESDATWVATLKVNANDIRVVVTGVAATTIEWGTTLKYMNMSN